MKTIVGRKPEILNAEALEQYRVDGTAFAEANRAIVAREEEKLYDPMRIARAHDWELLANKSPEGPAD